MRHSGPLWANKDTVQGTQSAKDQLTNAQAIADMGASHGAPPIAQS